MDDSPLQIAMSLTSGEIYLLFELPVVDELALNLEASQCELPLWLLGVLLRGRKGGTVIGP
ncbi:MAG: hypothetical protein AAF974_04015 [Cyanobacteria bacterium P01_E01_bin.34]